MKKFRFPALLLAVALLLLPGCNIIKVNSVRDGEQIVAVVNGENITKKQVYDAAGYTLGQKVDSWNETDFESQKSSTLEQLITTKVVLQQAKAKGFYTFTADEQKTIADDVAAYKKANYDAILANYQDQAKSDPSIKPQVLADAAITSYQQNETDRTAYNKLEKSITDAVAAPTDAAVQSAYTTQLTSQKTSYDTTPAQVITDNDNGSIILYYPLDTFVRAKEIIIPFPDAVHTEIQGDRTTNTKDSNAAAETLKTAELAKIVDKANTALASAKAANGDLTKLDQLIKDSAADPTTADTTTTILLYKDSTSSIQAQQDLINATLALTTVGTPTALVASDDGYHIRWLTEKIAKGPVPLDSVKVQLTASVNSTNQQTAWENSISGWLSDMAPNIKRNAGALNN